MNERDKIISVTETHPKQYSKMVRSDPDLWEWVQKNSTSTDPHIPTQIFSALSGTSGKCPNGNNYKYGGLSVGWMGCGRANVCSCTKEAVAKKVSLKKASRTQEDIDSENKKREETNLNKYGVSNVGKTEKARNNHKEFYDDEVKVKKAIRKYEETMLSKYGVTNPSLSEEIVQRKIETNLERYGVKNPMQNNEVAKKSGDNKGGKYTEQFYLKSGRKFIKMVENKYGTIPQLTPEEYSGVAERPLIDFLCPVCGSVETKRYDVSSPPTCKVCYPTEPSYESQEEVEVRNFIQTIYDGNLKIRDKSLINPFELDMVLIDKKIAIEYCGLYWHSENSSGGKKNWNYHQKKYLLAAEKGYRLITIFSDEWKNKKDIVKAKLNAIINDNTIRVGARKCQVKEISRKDASLFHNKYHIQGSPTQLKTNIGLFYKNNLVAVGSFSIRNGEVNLVRFSSSLSITGGCSRIVKYYFTNYPCEFIVSFADLRWSNGDMYFLMGFTEISRVPPMQSYVGNHYYVRYSKQAFPRKKINPDNLPITEWDRMKELGYDRIWDCGKIKFRLDSPFRKV